MARSVVVPQKERDPRCWNRDYWLARTTATDNTGKVQLSYKTARTASYEIVTGKPDQVFDHVAWIVQHDSCTPMYEHMLGQVIRIYEKDDMAQVEIYFNLYAGD